MEGGNPMLDQIQITNKTMELADCRNEWIFDEENRCWCLEDILYTKKATTPKFQRLSIFVPEPYMSEGGEINPAGEMNGYTAKTVPVIFEIILPAICRCRTRGWKDPAVTHISI